MVLLAFVAVVSALVLALDLTDVASLRRDLIALGPAGPVLFVAVYTLATLAPVPKNVLSALGGLLFGFTAGVALVYLAAMLGALAAFRLGRVLGREAVQRLTGARVARLDALLTRRGLLSVIAVRLVPVAPFTAVNYAAGLTGVRLRDYLVGTAIGMAPGSLAYVAVGAYGISTGSWPGMIALAVLVVLTLGGAVVARRSRR